MRENVFNSQENGNNRNRSENGLDFFLSFDLWVTSGHICVGCECFSMFVFSLLSLAVAGGVCIYYFSFRMHLSFNQRRIWWCSGALYLYSLIYLRLFLLVAETSLFFLKWGHYLWLCGSVSHSERHRGFDFMPSFTKTMREIIMCAGKFSRPFIIESPPLKNIVHCLLLFCSTGYDVKTLQILSKPPLLWCLSLLWRDFVVSLPKPSVLL